MATGKPKHLQDLHQIIHLPGDAGNDRRFRRGTPPTTQGLVLERWVLGQQGERVPGYRADY